jgi:hypothetical protein
MANKDYAYVYNGTYLMYGTKYVGITLSDVVIPIVTTTSISSIFQTEASGGGNVTSAGGGTVTAKGICWDVVTTPTVPQDPSTTNGSGTGSYNSALFNLNASTHYYVRAWALNEAGIAYGNEVTFDSSTSAILNGLVSFYKMDEAVASTTIIDALGINNGERMGNASTGESGKFTNAWKFSGSSADCASLGNKENLSLTTAGGISFWMYPTNLSGVHCILSKADYANDRNGYYIFVDGNYIGFNLADNNGYQNLSTVGITLNQDQWNHIVFTWDAANLYEYVNGDEYDTSNTIGSPTSNVYSLVLGGDNVSAAGFSGKLDEVGIWNRLLDVSEATWIYNSGTGRAYPF